MRHPAPQAVVASGGSQVDLGPFAVGGAFSGGPESGLWGDGGSGPRGTTLGCFAGRRYSDAFGVENRSKEPVALTGARGPNPAPDVVDLVAVQLRLTPKPPKNDRVAVNLEARPWSASPTGPVTIPPGRSATVQSNFLIRDCTPLASGRDVVVPGSYVLHYRASGHMGRQKIALREARFVLTRGPAKQRCRPASGSTSLVASDLGCGAARRAALACHPMLHGSWGTCSAAGETWDCGTTAGRGYPFLETCWVPPRKSRWFAAHWVERRSSVVRIVAAPWPEGPLTLVARAWKPLRGAWIPLREVERFVPRHLPTNPPQTCRVGAKVGLTLRGGLLVTYGPCERPASIERLRQAMLDAYRRQGH